jgi:hypothetical protein
MANAVSLVSGLVSNKTVSCTGCRSSHLQSIYRVVVGMICSNVNGNGIQLDDESISQPYFLMMKEHVTEQSSSPIY